VPNPRDAGWMVRVARADAWAAKLGPTIAGIQATGTTSLKGIARALMARGIRTPRGHGVWTSIQVARVLARIGVKVSPDTGRES
jgi:hypothetical protein